MCVASIANAFAKIGNEGLKLDAAPYVENEDTKQHRGSPFQKAVRAVDAFFAMFAVYLVVANITFMCFRSAYMSPKCAFIIGRLPFAYWIPNCPLLTVVQ